MGDGRKTTRQQSRHWSAIGATVATASLAAQTAAAADEAATQPYHAALTNHVPGFITGPGETDYLFVIVIVLLLAIILAIGNFYFQLHAVPERIAHRANKAQLEVVAVLALISLFTHNHIYWIIGLLLALVRIPDFSTPLYSIARSMARLASRVTEAAHEPVPGAPASGVPTAPSPAAAPTAGTTPITAAPVTPAQVTPAQVTPAPVTAAPIAPLPVAAAHPRPTSHTNAQPGPQPAEPAIKPDPQAEGI